MDTSDDPMTALLIAGAAAGGAAAGGAFSSKPSAPKAAAPGNPKETAAPQEQTSEVARRNRRMKASLLTQGFETPTLGTPGLLGK